jgi:uncharacterized protein (TIGR02646 family)
MIVIVKTAAPAFLLDRGPEATRQICALYQSAPHEYNKGDKTFDFDTSLYAAKEVKEALLNAQHKKCAFCESFFRHTGYGDVEHFRPKAGYKQKEADELKRPGYYWLVYAWDNLFCSCQLCNQQFKRNLFPLKDGRRRARTHKHKLDKEQPLLVDPSRLDPLSFIGFRQEYAYAVGDCDEGRCTIDVLGLNREELVEVRRDRLARLKDLVRLRELLRKQVATAGMPELSGELQTVEEKLKALIEPTGEYAAMHRAFLHHTAQNKA